MNYSSKILTDEFNKLVDYAQDYYDGITKILRVKPSVTILGASKASEDDFYYSLAYDISAELVQKDFGIITGGGPGIMEAANKAAYDYLGSSMGINVVNDFPPSPYIDRDKNVRFKHFAYRKISMMKVSMGFVVMPGGIGTINELFEIMSLLTLYNTRKLPVILVGKIFWSGLLDWLKLVKDEYEYLGKNDLNTFIQIDNPKEIAEIFATFYRDKMPELNF